MTFAPDDVYGVLNLRLSFPQKSNHGFPADDDGFLDTLRQGETHYMNFPKSETALSALLSSGFVGAAETFKLLSELVFNEILGTPSAAHTKSTKLLCERLQGLFGTAVSSFACVEEQARGSPHTHIVFWGGLPPSLLQDLSAYPDLLQRIINNLEEMFSATADPIAHLRSLLRTKTGENLQRPSLYPPHHPTTESQLFRNDVDRIATTVQIHQHTQTCRKTVTKTKCCRLARPQALAESSRMLQIVPNISAEGRMDYQ